MPLRSFLKKAIEQAHQNQKKELNLANQGIMDDECALLTETLNQYPSINVLNLYCNNIGNEGAKYLSELKYVEQLNVGHNNISNTGLEQLLNNPIIKSLDLFKNNINQKALELVIRLAHQTKLNVYHNEFSDEDLRKISEKIEKNKKAIHNTYPFFSNLVKNESLTNPTGLVNNIDFFV